MTKSIAASRVITATFAAVALAGASTAGAQARGERLLSPQLPGFVEGYAASNAMQSIREEVPRGETVQRWTRMVTTQRFAGLARQADPGTYARNVLAALPQACPGARSSAVTSRQVADRPAVTFKVDCPRNALGMPETFIFLAIAGRDDMHVKQVAFRGRPSAQDLEWARTVLAGVSLCLPGDKAQACSR